VYALVGRTAEARALVVPPTFTTSEGRFNAVDQAAASCALGDKATAYVWLNRAIDGREHDVQYLAVDPRFQALRGEPEYLNLLQRTGLEAKPGGAAR
jgi:hypothetical protein